MKLKTILAFAFIVFSTQVMAGEKIICINSITENSTQSFMLEKHADGSTSYKSWDMQHLPILIPSDYYTFTWNGNVAKLDERDGLGFHYRFNVLQKFEGASVKLFTKEDSGAYVHTNFHDCIYLP